MADQSSKPNILFILCDDLNGAVQGIGRKPCAPAPNLQKLMSRGVNFVNAHNNSPICLPSRHSLFSGIYPHKSGCLNLWDEWQNCTPLKNTMSWSPHNGQKVLHEAVTLPEQLQRSGYDTFGVGKLFHQGALKEEMWTEYGEGPNYGPFVRDSETGKVCGHPRNKPLSESKAMTAYSKKYKGIDQSWIGAGDRMKFPFEFDNGSMDDYYRKTEGIVVYYDGKDKKPFKYNSESDRDLLPDENYTDWAINKLHQQPTDRPFFLGVGYMKPHTPMIVPPSFIKQFPLDEIELPEKVENDIADCAQAMIDHRPYGFALYDAVLENGILEYKKWVQSYLASVAFIDVQVGRLLDALEASPHGKNTIVAFTSDNGYHMGEKDFLFKDTLWEASAQIPYIVSAPGFSRGAVCNKPVSLIDLYPSLLDLCGLDGEPNKDGHGHPLDGFSIRPYLENPNGDWQGPDVALTSVRGQSGVHHSVRSERYRYILCNNSEQELYDHLKDPHEWHNLALDPEHDKICSEHRDKMIALLYHC